MESKDTLKDFSNIIKLMCDKYNSLRNLNELKNIIKYINNKFSLLSNKNHNKLGDD